MFYNEQMQQNSVLSVPWQFGTNQIPLKRVELLKVCSTLEKWMDVDIDKKKHISLRTNAILLHGTIKLYRENANKLWQDCVQFNNEISLRKLPRDFFTEEDLITDLTTEDQLNTSEELSQRDGDVSPESSPSRAEKSSMERTSQSKAALELLAEKSSLERTSQRKRSKQQDTSEEQSQRISQKTSPSLANKTSLERTSQRQRSKQLNTSEEQRNSQNTSPSPAEVSSLERTSQSKCSASGEQSQCISQTTSPSPVEKSSLERKSQRKRSKQIDTSEKSPMERTSQRHRSKQLNTSEEQHHSLQKISEPLSATTNPETSRPTMSGREENINTRKRRMTDKCTKIDSKDIQRSPAATRNQIQFSGSLEMRTENTYVISREERLRYARWNLKEELPMAMVLTFGTTVEPEDIIFANIVE